MKSRTCWSFLVVGVVFAMGCADPDSNPEPFHVATASAPRVGAADSLDDADSRCQVVLRDVRRVLDGDAVRESCVGGDCWWVFRGTVDIVDEVTIDGRREILFSASSDSQWHRLTSLEQVGGAPAGYTRFAFELDQQTVADDGATLRVIPYVAMDSGRLFDHNRIVDTFAAYDLRSGNAFSVLNDGTACHDADITGTIQFDANFGTTVLGEVRPGRSVAVAYDTARLPECRSTAGNWATRANARFPSSGRAAVDDVMRFDRPHGADENLRLAVFEVPAGETELELSFENTSEDGTTVCHAEDADHRFDVVN